ITSDGFLNLTRIRPAVGFRLRNLPTPHPIFQLIQDSGPVALNEMVHVFNMGIGFCVIVPPDRDVIERLHDVIRPFGKSYEIGEVVDDAERRVYLEDFGLVGHDGRFVDA
ncbi:MAG: AIR synthase-related protein, partial [Gammaproteobacteria bacterium]